MTKAIVTTTVRRPTEAIERFDNLAGWTLIVVGDLKTPRGYRLKNGIYVSPEEQVRYHRRLSELIGWNTHARRNFGHLVAWDLGAEVVALVDDDNIPQPGWGERLAVGAEIEVDYYQTDLAAFDPIGATNYPHLWHRGFPIQLVNQRVYGKKCRKWLQPDVQADFWDGDPDVDAVCRMIYAPQCTFDPRCFPLASNRPSPFNSQNTFLSRKLLPYYFFLPHVSPLGRLGDIWMSYHLCWMGVSVVYGRPSVRQDRNEHDLTVDMRDEFVGYERTIDLVRSLGEGTYRKEEFWPARTCLAYETYRSWFSRTKWSAADADPTGR